MSTDIVKREAFDLAPVDLKEALEFAALIAKSDLAPRDFKDKPGNVLIAVQMGREVGLAPMQAIQSIAVINGRPSVWGDGALAVVQASGLLEDFCEMSFDEIKRAGYAKCTAIRKGQPTPIERVFSIEDAKSGGMWGRTNRDGSPSVWKAYPYRMLQMRARAFVLRDGFADVLKGLAIREEVQDYVSEVPDSRVINMPRRLSETKAEPETPASPEPLINAPYADHQDAPPPIIDEGGMFDAPPMPEREPGDDPPPPVKRAAGRLISDPQGGRLWKKARDAGLNDAQLHDELLRWGFESTKDVTRDVYEEICAHFDSLKK